MDFDSLMSQYKAVQQPSTVPMASEAATYQPESRKPRWRKPRFEPVKPEGRVIDLGKGEFKLDAMYGKYQLWDDDWVASPDDVAVVFEAKATNDITLALTPSKGSTDRNIYEIIIGGWKNTKSVIRTEVQGQERAVSFDARMCNGEAFLTYWIALQNGKIAVGTGDKPGHRVVLAWKNIQHRTDEPQPAFLSFSSWDNIVHIRAVRVSKCSSLDYNWLQYAGPEEDWIAKFVPSYIRAFEEERAENMSRADRFGVAFVAPDARRVFSKMSHVDRERAKAAQAGRLRSGFATGFDLESEEEIQAREQRAARFGLDPNTNNSDAAVPLLPTAEELESKRARAERFGVPITEQTKLVELNQRLSTPRRELQEGINIRLDAIHIYGYLAGIQTNHILKAFHGYDPSHVEWLNDESCNVCFADEFTCDRALLALTRSIPAPLQSAAQPTADRIAFDAELKNLIDAGWRFMAVMDRDKEVQYLLVRRATSADVKSLSTVVAASQELGAGDSSKKKRVREDNAGDDDTNKRTDLDGSN